MLNFYYFLRCDTYTYILFSNILVTYIHTTCDIFSIVISDKKVTCCIYIYRDCFVKMKIKMPCKLCEMTVDQQKLSSANGCTHKPVFLESPFGPFPLGITQVPLQNSGFLMPQVKDIMLAYLFKGEFRLCGKGYVKIIWVNIVVKLHANIVKQEIYFNGFFFY